MLTRREFGLAISAAQRLRPNVLIAMAAERSRDSTPAFLARDCVEYTRAYAVNPAFAPSRAALHTGRYPHQVGAAGDRGEIGREIAGVASQFTRAGYRTGYIGVSERSDLHRLGYGYVAEGGSPRIAATFLRGSRPFLLFVTMETAVESVLEQLVRTLAELRQVEDTIFVFTAGHGGGYGEQWSEPRVGIPLAMRWPRALPAGSKRDHPFCNVGLPALLASLCGVSGLEQPGTAESVYLQGELGTEGEWRAVVRGWDKLVVDRTLRVTHLLNLALDPAEQENLAGARPHLTRQEELVALLRRWILQTGDRVPFSGRAPYQEK